MFIEAAVQDSGGVDATVRDAGGADVTLDAADSGSVDAATHEAAPNEAGPIDGATTDGGSTADMACAPNNGGLPCTATEELFVQYSTDCYNCLVDNGCVNDSLNGDIGHECADLTTETVVPATNGQDPVQVCLDTIACVLKNACSSILPSYCYCGTAVGNACKTPGAANGACLSVESNGLAYPADDPVDVLRVYTEKDRPSGVANQIFSCAVSNTCTACLGQP